LSRSIGDSDAGPSITATPHVRQVEVPRCGGKAAQPLRQIYFLVHGCYGLLMHEGTAVPRQL
jgi:hypothetical protein